MDWAAISRVLAEQIEQPLAIVDGSSAIRLINRAMEQVLGSSRFEVEGSAWTDTFKSARSGSAELDWIALGLRGALREHEATLETKAGDTLAVQFELALVGHGDEQALLVQANRVLPLTGFRGGALPEDVDYAISLAGGEFGKLAYLSTNGRSLAMLEPDRRCYNVLYGKATPCDDCPLQRAQDGAGPWRTFRARSGNGGAGNGDGGGAITAIGAADKGDGGNGGASNGGASNGGAIAHFEVITAERVHEGIAWLHLRVLGEDVLRNIYDLKLVALAQRHGLTSREQEVLKYLVMGHSLAAIARSLGVAPRTIKYHQANALEKLGVRSRADLMRLLV
jgi:PAS domain S-box-containing protein